MRAVWMLRSTFGVSAHNLTLPQTLHFRQRPRLLARAVVCGVVAEAEKAVAEVERENTEGIVGSKRKADAVRMARVGADDVMSSHACPLSLL